MADQLKSSHSNGGREQINEVGPDENESTHLSSPAVLDDSEREHTMVPCGGRQHHSPEKGLLEVNIFNERAPKGEARQRGRRAHLGLETGVNKPEIGSSERREGVRWRCTGGHAPLPTPILRAVRHHDDIEEAEQVRI